MMKKISLPDCPYSATIAGFIFGLYVTNFSKLAGTSYIEAEIKTLKATNNTN